MRSAWKLAILGIAGSAVLVVSAAAATHGAKKQTITVWDITYFPKQSGSAGAFGRAEQKIDQAFMKKYPNIVVKHLGVPGTQFITSMRTFVATHRGPDVVTDGGGSFPQNAGFSKAMRPLYDLLTPQQKAELNPYLAGEAIGDPAHYSIPNVAGVYMFYYNKALFRKAKISAPPTTFDQLLNDCGALSKAGVTPIANGWSGIGGANLWNFGLSTQILGPNGVTAWAEQKIGWNDPRIVQGLTYLQQMAAQGCFGNRATASTTTGTDGVSTFQGGRGAMLFWYSLDPSTLSGIGGTSNVGVFAFPRTPNSPYPVAVPDTGYNGNWSIMSYTHHCRASWNYISFFTSREGQQILVNVGKTLPVNNTVTIKNADPLLKATLDLSHNKFGHHGIGATMSGAEDALQQQIAPELISGAITPQAYASQMQQARASQPAPPTTSGPLPKPAPCN